MRNKKQEEFSQNPNLESFASRLSSAIRHTGLNQTEFAKKLGISPGFMSDVVRGLKRPGIDFFYSARAVFGISADWLLTGEGSMNGAGGIDVNFYKIICLHIALAKSAVLEGNDLAKLLIKLAKTGQIEQMFSQPEYAEELSKFDLVNAERELAINIYNSQLCTDDPVAKQKNSVEAAITFFKSHQPLTSSFNKSDSSAPLVQQTNIGLMQDIRGGDFGEKK